MKKWIGGQGVLRLRKILRIHMVKEPSPLSCPSDLHMHDQYSICIPQTRTNKYIVIEKKFNPHPGHQVLQQEPLLAEPSVMG